MLILAVIFNVVERIIYGRQEDEGVESRGEPNLPGMNEYSEYVECRAGKNFGAVLSDSIFIYGYQHDPVAMRQFCLIIYNYELQYQLQEEKTKSQAVALTNNFFYDVLGTYDASKMFFDNVNASLGVRTKCYIAREAPRIWRRANSSYSIKARKFMHFLVSIFFYYFDLIKDVLLLTIMLKSGAKVETVSGINLPAVLFSVAILSLVFALLANMMSVLDFKPWNRTRRLLGALLILFIPGVTQYRLYRIESNLAENDKSKVDLFKDRTEGQALKGLKAKLRCNETSLEQLPQLVILILLILLRSSATVTLHSGTTQFAANLLSEDKEYILFGSAIWSFVSLVRSQLSLGFSIKRGFVPNLGKVLLFVYYSINTLARIVAFVFFFTPNLGLLDTRHHSLSGSLCAEMGVGVFDIENGNVKFFGQLWNNHVTLGETCSDIGEIGRSHQDCYHIPKELIVSTVPILLILHLILGLIFFQALFFGSHKLREVSWYKRFSQILHTLLCPPVHWDWDVLHRFRGGSLSVSECWSRSKKLLIAFNLLLLVEHILLMVPLMVLKGAIDKRNTLLSKDFPLTSDELYSTQRVNLILFCGVLGFVLLPIVSLLLAYIYFRKFHLWSRILSSHVQMPQLRGDVPMTSALRGREGVSQILTKGREVASIWY